MDIFEINKTTLVFHKEFSNDKFKIRIENGFKSTMSNHAGYFTIYDSNDNYVTSGVFNRDGELGMNYTILNNILRFFGFTFVL